MTKQEEFKKELKALLKKYDCTMEVTSYSGRYGDWNYVNFWSHNGNPQDVIDIETRYMDGDD